MAPGRWIAVVGVCLLVGFLAGCSGGTPPAPGQPVGGGLATINILEYSPAHVGDVWVYARVVGQQDNEPEMGGAYIARQLVLAEGPHAGKQAYAYQPFTEDIPPSDQVETYEWVDAEGTYHYGGRMGVWSCWSQPAKTAPAVVVVGRKYEQDYVEQCSAPGIPQPSPETYHYEVTVVAVGEQVTVPAGTFECIRMEASQIFDGSRRDDFTHWVAKGVGLVKFIDVQQPQGTRIVGELVGARIDRQVYGTLPPWAP